MKFPTWPRYEEDEIEAAQSVLRSGKVNYWSGNEGKSFETEFAEYCGRRYGVAVSNGTVALEIALRAVGVRPGDEVVVTPRSFIASASSAVSLGAIPVFADVDPVSQNVTAETIAAVLSPRTKAVVPVHLAGWPCDMPSIMSLAASRRIAVIEDCAQAHGARIGDRPVGSFGDFGAFSFCTDKIISTGGEGGMLVTDDEDLRERAWSLKDHGKNRRLTSEPSSSLTFRWVHESFGTNARLTEFQAAIGRRQLTKLEAWVAGRRRNADIISRRLRELDAVRIAIPPEHLRHAYYKYYFFLRDRFDRRDTIVDEINARGVRCFSGSCPEIYLERAFDNTDYRPADRLKNAKELGLSSLMLEVHPTLEVEHMQFMADVVCDVISSLNRRGARSSSSP